MSGRPSLDQPGLSAGTRTRLRRILQQHVEGRFDAIVLQFGLAERILAKSPGN